MQLNLITTGSLLFIIDNVFEDRTGFWRKTDANTYMLEKPYSCYFQKSKRIDNKKDFIMSEKTIKNLMEYKTSKGYSAIEILALCQGNSTTDLVYDNYNLNSLLEMSEEVPEDVEASDKFKELIKYYNNDFSDNYLYNVAKNLIKK